MRLIVRLAAIVGTAMALLRYDKARTTIAIVGVVVAVLSVTLLAGVGIGVVETGEAQFDRADRDLWVTGGPLELQPGTVGGIENTVIGAHDLADEMTEHPEVRNAVPMAFQTVYISTDGEEFDTMVASGVRGGGGAVIIDNGTGFTGGDAHYADGSYDGEMTHEAMIDPEVADAYDLEVGDTIHVGGTIAAAHRNEFEVIGITPTFRQFLQTDTVTVQLSELQTITGTAATDRATLLTIALEDGADPDTVAAELQAEYPDYEVRTNQEQLVATLQNQAVVLASGVSLLVLAVVAGAALTMNLLMSLIYQQRKSFSMLTALGAPITTPIGIAIVQALVVGTIGGLLGVAVTVPAVEGLDRLAEAITGFEGVAQTRPDILLGGFTLAIGTSILGAIASAWRIAGTITTESLEN